MRLKSDLILLFVAAIWGSGFVAQRLAAAQLSAFYFNGGRFLAAALILFLLLKVQRNRQVPEEVHQMQAANRHVLPWMVLAGVLLFAAAGLQQAGLATTTIGNASFITGLYVVLVPLILWIFWKEQVSWFSWLAVGLAVAGVMLLSLRGGMRLSPGDALELAGALIWALHVILVGRLAGQSVDVLAFSVIQFTTCGLLNLALALGLDPAGAANLSASWLAVLYSAVFPIGLGFTLQIFGQRHAPPVDAAIILSMEALFGTLFGLLILREMLTLQQWFGCALLLTAMILSQLKPGQPPVLETESELARIKEIG